MLHPGAEGVGEERNKADLAIRARGSMQWAMKPRRRHRDDDSCEELGELEGEEERRGCLWLVVTHLVLGIEKWGSYGSRK